ncbi:MAG: hypothetical protein MI919_38975, partial [Holophagales bacterium]|nr:hypothetical protein [Holophagales bacterium]
MKQPVYRFALALALCLPSIPTAAGEGSRVHVSADKALTAPAGVEMAPDTASLTFQLTPLPSASERSPVSAGVYPGPGSGAEPDLKVAVLGGELEIVAGVGDEDQPAIAYNSSWDEYMVVYSWATGGPTGRDIYGQRLANDGTAIGAPFTIMAEPGNEASPRITYNPDDGEFLIAAVLDDDLGVEVILRTIGGDGTPTGVIWGPFPDSDREHAPDVVFNSVAGEYLVVAHTFVAGNGDLLLQRVGRFGELIDFPKVLSVDNGDSPASLAFASVSWDPGSGDYWMVFQLDYFNDDSDIDIFAFAVFWDLVGDPDLFNVASLTANGIRRNELRPRLAWNSLDGHFLVAFQFDKLGDGSDFDIYALRKRANNGTVGGVLALATSGVQEFLPAPIYQHDLGEFHVFWEADSATTPIGLRFGGLDSFGTPLPSLSSAGLIAGAPAIAGTGGKAIVVWESLNADYDLRGRWIGEPAPVLRAQPTTLAFGESTDSLDVDLFNDGTGVLTWSSISPPWLGLSPPAGSFFDQDGTTATVNRSSLLPGVQTGTLTIASTGGNVDVAVEVTVVNEAPNAPTLVAPADTSSNQPASDLLLDWSASDPNTTQPLSFDVYLSSDQNLVTSQDAGARVVSTLGTDSLIVDPGYGTTFYWRVVTSDGSLSTAGPVWSFSTESLGAPTLISPFGTILDVTPLFRWNAVFDAASYQLQVSTASDFSSLVVDQSGITETGFVAASPLGGGTYYWRVAAVPAAGAAGAYSATGTFVVDTSLPVSPVLEPVPSPSNNRRPSFSWSAALNATRYRIDIARDPDFNVWVYDTDVFATSWDLFFNLSEDVYYWKVTPIYASGASGPPSATSSFEVDLTAPFPPSLIAIPNPYNVAQPTFSWNASPGAAEYLIQVTNDGFFSSVLHQSDWIPETSWTVPTADLPDGFIYWRVFARDAAGNASGPSAASSFRLDTGAPAAPTSFAVSPDPGSDQRPRLRWGPVADGHQFRVQVATDEQFTLAAVTELGGNDGQKSAGGSLLHDVVVSGFDWTVTSDLPEGRIFWRVAAIDLAGNQGPYSTIDDFVVDVTPPAVPTLTPVFPDPTIDPTPTLTWSAEPEAVAYRIQISTDPAFTTTLADASTAGTSYTPSSLTDGTYYWRVASRDEVSNDSAFSATQTFDVDTTAPGVPSLTPVSPDPTNNRRPTLAWSSVSGADSYRLQVSKAAAFNSFIIDTTLTTTSWSSNSDLPEGTIYWRVASSDAPGNASAFSTADDFTIDLTPPVVPTLVAYTPDPGNQPRPTLSWNAIVDAAEYRVQVSSAADFASTLFDVTVTAASWTPTADLPEATIYWRVSASDSLANTSDFSAADSFEIDLTPPSTPSLTAVTPDPISQLRPSLSWSSVADAAEYRVQVASDAGFVSMLFDLTVAGTSWTPTSDLPEGTIYWRAAAVDTAGNQSPFPTADSFEIDVTAPAVPTLTPVTPDPTNDPRPSLAWAAVSGASDYRVQVAQAADFAAPIFDLTISATAWVPTSDLPEGTIYWRAASRDALANTSAFSGADSFDMDLTAPAVPTLVAVTPDPTNDSRPSLAWAPVSGANDYRVQVALAADFAAPIFDLTVGATAWTPTSDLPEGTIYWRAASRDALANTSAFSVADSFDIDIT